MFDSCLNKCTVLRKWKSNLVPEGTCALLVDATPPSRLGSRPCRGRSLTGGRTRRAVHRVDYTGSSDSAKFSPWLPSKIEIVAAIRTNYLGCFIAEDRSKLQEAGVFVQILWSFPKGLSDLLQQFGHCDSTSTNKPGYGRPGRHAPRMPQQLAAVGSAHSEIREDSRRPARPAVPSESVINDLILLSLLTWFFDLSLLPCAIGAYQPRKSFVFHKLILLLHNAKYLFTNKGIRLLN